eukprot:jgi/Ulvmu1/9872/UM057_0026.1
MAGVWGTLLLVAAVALVASANGLRQAPDDCWKVTEAGEVLDAIQNDPTLEKTFCFVGDSISPVSFRDLPPLRVPAGYTVGLLCAGHALQLFTPQGPVDVGAGGTLRVTGCAVETYDGGSGARNAVADPPEAIARTLVNGQSGSRLQLEHSTILMPWVFPGVLSPTILETMQLEQPSAYATMGPLVRDTAAWALTLTAADFNPGPMSSVLYTLEATNTTLWCGPSAADAAPVIREARTRSFVDALPYHEVLAAQTLPTILINGTEAAEPAVAVPAAPAEAGGEPAGADAQAVASAQQAPAPMQAAQAGHAAGGDVGAIGSRPGGSAAPAGAPPVQRQAAAAEAADASAAMAPAAPIAAGGGTSTQAWLVPFLSVLVVVLVLAILACLCWARRRHRRFEMPIRTDPKPFHIFHQDSSYRHSSRASATTLPDAYLSTAGAHRTPTKHDRASCASRSGDGGSGSGEACPGGRSRAQPDAVQSAGLPSGSTAPPTGSPGGRTAAAEGARRGRAQDGSSGLHVPLLDTSASSAANSGAAQFGTGVRTMKDAVGQAIRQMEGALAGGGDGSSDMQLRVHALIGRGGFGTVYRGEWRGLQVAIKTVMLQRGACEADVARVASEAAIAASLVHPNIVATYSHDISTSPDQPRPGAGTAAMEAPVKGDTNFKFYLIQEYCNAGSVRSAVSHARFLPPLLPQRWRPIMAILSGIATGMAHMHAKDICHGDLNPSNVLLKVQVEAPRGGPLTTAALQAALQQGGVAAKITDFGMAALMQRGCVAQRHSGRGTPFFVAPEVLRSGHIHRSSDVFSFGVIMWELMAGTAVYVPRDELDEPDAQHARCAFVRHPAFPYLPATVPLTFTLTMKACLSENPDERPTFGQILTIFDDVVFEVASGSYLNSLGQMMVSEAVQVMPTDHPPQEHLIESTFNSDPAHAPYPPNPSGSWGAQGPPSSRGAYSGVSVASRVSLSSQIWRTNFQDVLAALPKSPRRSSPRIPDARRGSSVGGSTRGTPRVQSPAGSPQKQPRRLGAAPAARPRRLPAAAEGSRSAPRGGLTARSAARDSAAARPAAAAAAGASRYETASEGGRSNEGSESDGSGQEDDRFQTFDGISTHSNSDGLSDACRTPLPVRVSAAQLAQQVNAAAHEQSQDATCRPPRRARKPTASSTDAPTYTPTSRVASAAHSAAPSAADTVSTTAAAWGGDSPTHTRTGRGAGAACVLAHAPPDTGPGVNSADSGVADSTGAISGGSTHFGTASDKILLEGRQTSDPRTSATVSSRASRASWRLHTPRRLTGKQARPASAPSAVVPGPNPQRLPHTIAAIPPQSPHPQPGPPARPPPR